MSAGRLLRTYISMAGSDVLTIISSVTRAFVCASAGIEASVARRKPAAAIERFNVASHVFFCFVVTWRDGISRRPVRITRLNPLFTISIHNRYILAGVFSWLTELEG